MHPITEGVGPPQAWSRPFPPSPRAPDKLRASPVTTPAAPIKKC
ncbi:MAG: hypothetical protein ACJ8G3_07215 [Burkholderiaceae bacterium]